MNISIHVNADVPETAITITCSHLTPEIERVLATLRMLDQQIMATRDDVSKVIYLESIDRKTFAYTQEAVYETKLKLYELEQQLEAYGFFRASKSCLVQIKYIRSLKMDIGRKIRVTLENGEQIMVSRLYADGLKRKFGVK